ncbi:MAG: Bax inhibitor-1/YccA family protein [Chloroflexota bacterium]
MGFNDFDWNNARTENGVIRVEGTTEATMSILRWVYMWMGLGMLTTAMMAYLTYSTPALLAVATSTAGVFGSIILSLGLVFALSFAINRVSPMVAGFMFFGYALVLGFSLSTIFLVYTSGTISTAFFTTSVMFGIMTVFGFTTKMDLTRFGAFFMMALIGLIVAMVINFFIGSSALDLIISWVGVLIFVGLTAYDTQRIKYMAADPAMQADSDMAMKMSIIGALGLYLNFINIFLFLLQILGGGRD